jgi:hypothetical protein
VGRGGAGLFFASGCAQPAGRAFSSKVKVVVFSDYPPPFPRTHWHLPSPLLLLRALHEALVGPGFAPLLPQPMSCLPHHSLVAPLDPCRRAPRPLVTLLGRGCFEAMLQRPRPTCPRHLFPLTCLCSLVSAYLSPLT